VTWKKWATGFKENHTCDGCPFVINEVDIDVGIQWICNHVCDMEIEEIVKEVEGYEIEI
jgi:hypothetical protein